MNYDCDINSEDQLEFVRSKYFGFTSSVCLPDIAFKLQRLIKEVILPIIIIINIIIILIIDAGRLL